MQGSNRENNIVIWQPCNVYDTAIIRENVSVGMFTEIGHNVFIGPGTRVGAHCFIPECVIIRADCFIGPHCVFTNDRLPPSNPDNWEETVVERGASIGAGCTIRCGITIGEGARIGCGSVVTKNVPAGETWCGVPAKRMSKKDL